MAHEDVALGSATAPGIASFAPVFLHASVRAKNNLGQDFAPAACHNARGSIVATSPLDLLVMAGEETSWGD